jgi:hypothetical protein
MHLCALPPPAPQQQYYCWTSSAGCTQSLCILCTPLTHLQQQPQQDAHVMCEFSISICNWKMALTVMLLLLLLFVLAVCLPGKG